MPPMRQAPKRVTSAHKRPAVEQAPNRGTTVTMGRENQPRARKCPDAKLPRSANRLYVKFPFYHPGNCRPIGRSPDGPQPIGPESTA